MKRILAVAIAALFFCSAFADNLKLLVVADVHHVAGQEKTQYGKSGSRSDTGDDLLGSLVRQVKVVSNNESPDVTLILGDLPGHGLSDRVRADQTVLNKIKPSLPAHKPVFYVIGNNDSFGGNYHSFSQVDWATGTIYSPLQLFDNNIPGWNIRRDCRPGVKAACFIDSGDHQGHPFYFGYYSAYVDSGRHTRLIALNSVMILGDNYYVNYTSDDGVSQQQAVRLQFDWLKAQLQQAADRNERVIIAMHIPSGINSYSGDLYWLGSYQKDFAKLIHRYHDRISLMLSGHTHMNELHFYRHQGIAEVAAMGVPGVTPLHGNDPGFNMLTFTGSDGGYYLSAKQSKSYRYDTVAKTWINYTDFSLCDSKENSLLKLAQICPRADVESWVTRHFAQGNSGFKPNQGKKAIKQAIWVGTQ